jgi:LmbE family N-acetylglucosaminyl deacetylase
MKRQAIVVAPHPDDETFGCGGTILRHRDQGDAVHWVIVTGMGEADFAADSIVAREREIEAVKRHYGFESVHSLGFPTTLLDTVPVGELVGAFKAVFNSVKPDTVYLPYRGDVHTDHRVVFDAVVSCTKWFRYPTIKRILAYETLSETEFGLDPDTNGFRPNVFINISAYLENKHEILEIYGTELGEFPFPRSIEAVRALAALRGATAGCAAAEAFMLLKEII